MRTQNTKAFTLIELLVVVAIIAALIAMLLPALAAAREQSKKVICASNQRQVGVGLMMYLNDYNGWYPPDINFNQKTFYYPYKGCMSLLTPSYGGNYIEDLQAFYCPSDTWVMYDHESSSYRWPYRCSYGWVNMYFSYGLNDPNGGYFSRGPMEKVSVESNNRFVIMGDRIEYCYIWPPSHADGMNVLFIDGHVTWCQDERIIERYGTPSSGSNARNAVYAYWLYYVMPRSDLP